MALHVDHVVILVDDLDTAVGQYQELGFTVLPGGRHPRFTHNALVTFQDGAYLELIAFYEHPQPGSEDTHRWHRHVATGGGLVDFAVGTNDLSSFLSSATSRGIETNGIQPGARTRPDGRELRWQSAMHVGENVGALPFIIEDLTEREWRVPREGADHANGVRGVHSLTVAVRDLDAASARYVALTGNQPTVADADHATFTLNTHVVDLVTPREPGEMREQLDRRGDGLFALTLLGREDRDVDPREAGGARLRIVSG